MSSALPEVFLVRHGETAWTTTGRMTGNVDLPLTPRGESEAQWIEGRLRGIGFHRVFMSPRIRARRTAEIAGLAGRAEVDPDLVEWDYGRYQGRRLDEVHVERPGWSLFRDGCPEGESVEDIAARADRVVTRLRGIGDRVALFGHGHFFRALGARWLGAAVGCGAHLLLSTGALSVLGYEHTLESPVLVLWNERPDRKP
ncbi:MAG TPA: histidine phosphatase family protein [Candidatus Udaeobacter sp.]|jgi:probable phosphoglycerate mutase|nr:histidine phosphatase family protein [Candidatus Udaeobacter sp.]